MNFKQALIAHFSGERVVCRYKPNPDGKWKSFLYEFRDSTIECIDNDGGTDDDYEFRLAPRTIMCNGVEVVAGEIRQPEPEGNYYCPNPVSESMVTELANLNPSLTLIHLERGLVYLNKEDAIARAKAMLITHEVK